MAVAHPTISIYSRKQTQKKHSRDGGGKQLKKRTRYATVHCDRHGRQAGDGRLFREVSVPLPKTRREQYSGCPVCAQEARKGLTAVA